MTAREITREIPKEALKEVAGETNKAYSSEIQASEIQAFDYVHFYVEDAKYWSEWFCECLEFKPTDCLTGDLTYTELRQGTIQIRLSEATPKSPVAEYLTRHPAGIAEIGLAAMGTTSRILTSPNSDLKFHLLPKSKPELSSYSLFSHIDHLVINLPNGTLEQTSQWYEQVLGLRISDRFNIQTDRSGLKSLVLENHNHAVQIPLNQPSSKNSQVQEFLDFNRGAGVQHLALYTDQIEKTVDILKSRGVKFLATSPPILYEKQDYLGKGILQIFTQPLFGQPTFFFEIIQRLEGAKGFGAGNFQALFEAIEQEQIKRSPLS
jgi:4-hydroxyphenylpyruvate dioxygenase